MNFQRKPIPAAVPLRSTADGSTAPVFGPSATPIGADALSVPTSPTGEAGAPNLSNPSRNPDCIKCGRGFYGCICGCPEPEQEWFEPGIKRDHDWFRVEL